MFKIQNYHSTSQQMLIPVVVDPGFTTVLLFCGCAHLYEHVLIGGP